MPESEENPSGPRKWQDIRADLSKDVPRRLLATKRLQGNSIEYIPWYKAQQLLDHYTRGHWEYRVMEREQLGKDFCITVCITVYAEERAISREGTGREEMGVSGYGDSQSNAESMAFRRACAKFGLGLALYDK